MTFYEYINNGYLWLSVLVILVTYKFMWFFISRCLLCMIDDIKYDAVEEYKKNGGKNDAID